MARLGYTSQPAVEFAGFGVASFLNCDDSFDKSFLKQVVCQVAVFHNVLYVRIDAVLIPFEQNVEGLIIAVSIQSHQDVVCKNF